MMAEPTPAALRDTATEHSIWDIAVVGAGPAGAMAAHELARLGCSVLILDRDTFPRWKVCGACLSPGAQEVLRAAGLGGMLTELGASPLDHLEVRGWGRRARLPLRGSVALSRIALDAALVGRAERMGARLVEGVRVRLGPRHPDFVQLRVGHAGGSTEINARIAIAADGLRSGLLAQAGVGGHPDEPSKEARVGLGAVFRSPRSEYGPGTIHMAAAEEGYVGLARVEDGSLDVAAALDPVFLRKSPSPAEAIDHILESASYPPLGRTPAVGWKGTKPLNHRPRKIAAHRLFAVGDAAGYVEPFTGEGMCWAMAGGRALAPIAARASQRWHEGHAREWTDTYRSTISESQRLCSAAAWTLRRPGLSRLVIGALGRFPGVAAPLVGRAATPPKLSHRRPS
jgi:flavin-dependent dehydrogenase